MVVVHWMAENAAIGMILVYPPIIRSLVAFVSLARISKAKRRKRVTRDMSTLKNSMLELAAKFDDNYNTGLIKSFMFGLNKTEIKNYDIF
ncbi:hypothetical protein TNCV_3130741 [Trichonephila clavipes]|nr:hypothetical protein TNCV_3130741 [Trichonephila clavipes]